MLTSFNNPNISNVFAVVGIVLQSTMSLFKYNQTQSFTMTMAYIGKLFKPSLIADIRQFIPCTVTVHVRLNSTNLIYSLPPMHRNLINNVKLETAPLFSCRLSLRLEQAGPANASPPSSKTEHSTLPFRHHKMKTLCKQCRKKVAQFIGNTTTDMS